MKPGDVAIWERFIDKFPDFFDSVDYDVNIGEGADFDTTITERTGKTANALYKKKVDVVGYKENEIWLVEVKPLASTLAVGQVSIYDEIYRSEKNPAEKVVNAVLTDALTPDTKELARKWEVELIVV